MAPIRKNLKPLRRTFLKQWRIWAGLTQDRAGERLNMSRTTLSKIENAKSPYSQRFLEAAAEAYGCQPEDLLMRDPSQPDAIWSILETLKKGTAEQLELVVRLSETVMRKTGT